MKQTFMGIFGVLLAISLTACGTDEGTSRKEAPSISRPSVVASSSEETVAVISSNVTSSEEMVTATSSNVTSSKEIVEVTSSNVYSSESMPPESMAASKAPSSTVEVSSTETIMPPPESIPEPTMPEEDTMHTIQITVGNKIFSATLEENDAANSFMQMLKTEPVVIQMSDYSGFEKVGSLKTRLPESNSRITAQSGDIILYNGNQIVMFYGSNSWSYTKLGKIDDLSGWEDALGGGDVTVTFGAS